MKSTFKLLALAWLIHSLVSHAPAQVVSGTTPGGIRSKTLYANAGQNLYAFKAAATNGMTIVVGPGLYGPTVTNLLKNGVNWHFMAGAVISNNYSADVGCFDNTYEGNPEGVTSIISGSLVFKSADSVSIGSLLIRGTCLTVSNPLSRISFEVEDIIGFSANVDAAIRVIGGKLDFKLREIDYSLGGYPLAWGEGNETVNGTFQTIKASDYPCLWAEGNGSANWYLTGHVMHNLQETAIWFKVTNPNQKLWIKPTEILGVSGFSSIFLPGVLTMETGKVYIVEYGKLSAASTSANVGPLIGVTSGELWLTGQKMTVTNNQHFVGQTGGRAWVRNQFYEDAGIGAGARPYNYLVSGGTNYLQGGRANSLSAPWAKLTGGQLQLEDMTIDTLTGATMQPSNSCLWITGGTPTIKDCVFIPSCLFSVTNASAGDLRVYGTGGLIAKSNISTATLTVRVGSVTVDNTYADR